MNRIELINRFAPGRSFLDLGGMYRIAGETAFAAERAGASRVVLFDGMDPSEEFMKKHKANESKVEFVQGDLHDPDAIALLGEFDIVWCTGVIYHTPHPMQQLIHLRRLTKETLVLGTNVMPDFPGIEQVCVLYAGLSETAQSSYAMFHGGPNQFPGMTSPFDTTPLMSYANMWFGISPSALRSMLRYSGFDVIEEHPYTPFWIDVVAQPGGVSLNTYPPLSQSDDRVLARHADTNDDDLPIWAERQVRLLRGRV
jgi:SAM-dependent methyltransferase